MTNPCLKSNPEKGGKMKAKVDENLCTGCGLCVDTCPEVFQMGDATAKVVVDVVPADAEDKAREAAENCPVDAITIE
jgi:ferredoxin